MTVRAVIFDVYATILEVTAPPPHAEDLWQELFAEMLSAKPPLTRTQFSVATGQVIARLHAEARAQGIPWPEVLWPRVVMEVLPDLAQLPVHQLDDFLLRQMQMGRTLRLADGAAECLSWLKSAGRMLGIASNSQAYTLRELHQALSNVGLDLSVFERDLCFWSFEHGFSKPDPHVFRILSARLEARGVFRGEALMVGDRLDNDVTPARTQGWQTWLLQADSPLGGNFRQLLAALKESGPLKRDRKEH